MFTCRVAYGVLFNRENRRIREREKDRERVRERERERERERLGEIVKIEKHLGIAYACVGVFARHSAGLHGVRPFPVCHHTNYRT